MQHRRNLLKYLLFVICIHLLSTAVATSQETGTSIDQQQNSVVSASATQKRQPSTDPGRSIEFRLNKTLILRDWKWKLGRITALGISAEHAQNEQYGSNHVFTLSQRRTLFVAPSIRAAAALATRGNYPLSAGHQAPLADVADTAATSRLRLVNQPLSATVSSEPSSSLNRATVAADSIHNVSRIYAGDNSLTLISAGKTPVSPLISGLSIKVGEDLFFGPMVGGKTMVEDIRDNDFSEKNYETSRFLAGAISLKF